MHYAWFVWSLLLLLVWLVIYTAKRNLRREMLRVSLWTMPFGLTEPLFVPEYWNPPSLFDLAQRTGFDIESLIFRRDRNRHRSCGLCRNSGLAFAFQESSKVSFCDSRKTDSRGGNAKAN